LSERFDETDERDEQGERGDDSSDGSLERASENVLDGWPAPPSLDDTPVELDEPDTSGGRDRAVSRLDETVVADPYDDDPAAGDDDSSGWALAAPAPTEADVDPQSWRYVEADAHEPVGDDVPAEPVSLGAPEHAPGELVIPPDVPVLEGEVRGERRAVGLVVSRFNGEVTSRLLESALAELEAHGVATGSITVMPVPGAFELPVAAMALAKTRRFACIVALGCVIRGDTPHFDYVASEAASGLQLASIETGVPVAFGVLTLDRPDQAEARFGKGAEAVRTALEMADLFANLRAAAAR
jgi:6,7-dimethyl-8-ribityllumazine synthase